MPGPEEKCGGSDEPLAVVLALDPGRAKCGLAVVARIADQDGPGAAGRTTRVLHREVVETERVVARVLPLLAAHGAQVVLVGDATGGSVLARALKDALPPTLPVTLVDEAFTSQRARRRFLQEHQPRGLQRLLPAGLRTPPVPVDDYAAVLLAEDYLAAAPNEGTSQALRP